MDIHQLISRYTEWFKSEITFEKIGEYYEINTPFLDNANDYLQIYVKQEPDNIILSDDGYTIQNLKMNGFNFTPKRREHLDRIVKQYGIELVNDELIANTSINQFPYKKHMFIQAMLKIDDMFTINQSRIASLFLDDIQEFFQQHGIFYVENLQFTGTSGFTHQYDFLFQRSKTKPERLCRAINHPNKSNMSNVLFEWNDIKPLRKKDSQLVVFLNDNNEIAKGVIDGFLNYDAKVICWSKREQRENLNIISA